MTAERSPRHDELEALLLEQLASHREQLQRLTEEYEQLTVDPSVLLEDRNSAQVLVEGARDAVDRLEEALARLEEGTYGRCERCGELIAAERMLAIPDATTCVTCTV